MIAGSAELSGRGFVGPSLAVRFETESFDEMYEGDAVPTVDAGWIVVETSAPQDDGKEIYRLTADAEFGPEEPLPSSYASPRDPDPDLWTRFPTEVTIEERRDGTYYHFARRYTARPWARLETARAMMKEQLEKMETDDLDEMTDAERATLLRVLARFESMKTRVFARAAYRETLGDLPQDLWLGVHAALMEATEALDYDEILTRIFTEERELDEEAMAAEDAAHHEQALETMRHALRLQGLSEGRLNAFVRRFRWHVRYEEITEDLADDKFIIEVTMPGTIIGHNADRVDGRTAAWSFGGEQLRDRDLELLVTSRLAG